MRKRETIVWAALMLSQPACSADEVGDPDRGPIEATLRFEDRINWPGLDKAGGRVIPFLTGFADGEPSGYWFLGFATRDTADVFVFCREGEVDCPVDQHRRINWNTLVGHPIFTRIPGDPDFSPFWVVWKVTVPPDYVPDSVKTIPTLDRLRQAGELEVEPFIYHFGDYFGEDVGPRQALLHCAMVLSGTELKDNGGPMPDGSGMMQRIERRLGWFDGYRVEFLDFSTSEGLFPEDDDSGSRSRMRFANIYIYWRLCDLNPSGICELTGHAYEDRRPVSERGLGQDITGDGDFNDTNNVLGAIPCKLARPTERPYSPLWGPLAVNVLDPSEELIDTTADQLLSDQVSADTLFDQVAAGRLAEPIEMREDETGNPVPGNEGRVFFNCPAPVPADFVPFPCEETP